MIPQALGTVSINIPNITREGFPLKNQPKYKQIALCFREQFSLLNYDICRRRTTFSFFRLRLIGLQTTIPWCKPCVNVADKGQSSSLIDQRLCSPYSIYTCKIPIKIEKMIKKKDWQKWLVLMYTCLQTIKSYVGENIRSS